MSGREKERQKTPWFWRSVAALWAFSAIACIVWEWRHLGVERASPPVVQAPIAENLPPPERANDRDGLPIDAEGRLRAFRRVDHDSVQMAMTFVYLLMGLAGSGIALIFIFLAIYQRSPTSVRKPSIHMRGKNFRPYSKPEGREEIATPDDVESYLRSRQPSAGAKRERSSSKPRKPKKSDEHWDEDEGQYMA